MTYDMLTYGNDKPDIRFGMEFGELNEVAQNKEFLFQYAELVVGIAVPVQEIQKIDAIEWVKRPQVGASGMVYVNATKMELQIIRR
jgi:aspartyl-tRNA synthetase